MMNNQNPHAVKSNIQFQRSFVIDKLLLLLVWTIYVNNLIVFVGARAAFSVVVSPLIQSVSKINPFS